MSASLRAAVVPGALALLPAYAAATDPFPELRLAVRAAVDWLGPAPEILGDAQGRRVGQALVEARGGFETVVEEGAPRPSRNHLVVANGTARRSRTSPGPYDERARPFDDQLGKALLAPDPDALRVLDQGLATELWASTAALAALADLLTGEETVTVDYDAAPYGVQYWVVRYER
ncbi:hypothetical protein [Nocardioides sp. KR10-350]|uniref:hypothetical protein n=1 Tax=Nocardioides cheoyonin TaxID=3156615 RepID=UPI0032B4871D